MTETPAPVVDGQGTPPVTPPAAAAPWYGDVQDAEMKGWIENKGFDKQAPMAALTSYRNLEKAFGADKAGRTVLLPGDKAEKSELDTFFNKLGRPETPDKYEFQNAENADKGFLDWAKATFHEAGLSGKQAQALLGKYQEFSGGRAEALNAEDQNKIIADNQALRSEWGGAHDQKMAQAKAAAQQFGFTAAEVDALEKQVGFAGVMKRFADIGAKLGEGGMIRPESQSTGFAQTPAQAEAKLAELHADKAWMSSYLSGSKSHLEQEDNLQRARAAGGKR